MVLSTNKVEVVPITLETHVNADTLSVVRVFDGFPCCVRTADWVGVDRGAYLPPDSVVDVTRPEFAFLASGDKITHRIKAKKLRGVVSFGLLMPAPPGSKIGDDVAFYYGVTHYAGRVAGEEDEPEQKPRSLAKRLRGLWWKLVLFVFPSKRRAMITQCEQEKPPSELACLKKYDIDSMRRYKRVFVDGEPVMVTEKIHGANARYCWLNGRLWAGSRTQWKRKAGNSIWWRAADSTPQIEEFCKSNPGHILYGEVYGNVQELKYGAKPGEVRFAAFDILKPTGEYIAATAFREECDAFDVPMVPLLIDGVAFNFDELCRLAEGKSLIPGADHVREGIVVRPMVERYHQNIGRVVLKIVGAGYLEKSSDGCEYISSCGTPLR